MGGGWFEWGLIIRIRSADASALRTTPVHSPTNNNLLLDPEVTDIKMLRALRDTGDRGR